MNPSTFAHRALVIVFLVWGLTTHASSRVAGQAGAGAPQLITQINHSGRIHSMVVSLDGRLVATAGSDHTVKLWDAARGALIRNLEGHTGEVKSVAFSTDGQRLISAGHDPVVRVWEVATGRLLRSITGDAQSWTGGAAFAEDENLVVVAGRVSDKAADSRAADRLNEIAIWNLQTGRKVRSVQTNGYCDPVSFTGDRSIAMCGGGEMWDLRTLKRLESSEGYTIRNDDASFSPNGNLMATVTFAYGLQVWDTKRLSRLHTNIRSTNRSTLSAVAFAPDGQTIAAGDERGNVGLWDASSGEIRGPMVQLKSRKDVTKLAFTPDGKTLLAASLGEPVAEIATLAMGDASPALTGTFLSGDRSTAAVAAAGNNSAAAGTGAGTGAGAGGGAAAAKQGGAVYGVTTVRISPDGRTLATGGADKLIHLWNLQSGQLAHTLRGHPNAIRNLAFSPDGSELAVASEGGGSGQGLRLWDVRTGAQTRLFDGILVNNVAFHPDGRTIVSGGSMRYWDTSADKEARRIPLSCDFLAMSPDGNMLACAWDVDRLKSDRQAILLVDAKSGKEVKQLNGHLDKITSAVFSADNARLISSSADKTVRIWDVKSGGLTSTLSGHNASVLSVAVNPAGLVIASGSADGTIKLWDSRGRLTSTLTGHTNVVNSVTFGPEGTTLASGSNDGTVRIWSPAKGALLATLMSFGDDQWLAYGPQGHYMGSAERDRFVGWRVGNTVYDFDQFFERFYTPDLLVRIFQGAAPPVAEAPAGGAPPPAVVIVSPRPGQEFRDPDIEVVIEVKNAGGGINDVRLSLNGKTVDSSSATRGLSSSPAGTAGAAGAAGTAGASTYRYRVPLLEGANVLRATAFSSDRTESTPHEMTVRLGAPVKEATLRLLAVGVSRYQNPGLTLAYPTADVKDLVTFFKTGGSRLFKEVDVTELNDEAATEANIKQALVALQRRALPQDVVIVFLSGHGANAGTSWYFIPHDLRNPEQQDELTKHGLSSEALALELKRVSSQKVLLLVDSCYSGSMLTAFRGYEDRKALAQLARSAGIHILAASSNNQRASEVTALGHGVFSYALLRGLEGGAALRGVDKQVTVQSLVAYIRAQLPDLGRKYQAEVQDPVSITNGMDFPLALTR